MSSWRKATIALALAAAASIGLVASTATAEDTFSPYVDDAGNISFPEDFRTSMIHLGSWFVPDGAASGFHGVYAEKEAVEKYRKTGQFSDGSILVKELRASESGHYTTGAGVSYSTNEIKQWFVMIKDSQGRFEENPLWGDGWGWALFKADDKSRNAASDYQTDCLGCHQPAKAKDWLYVEAYPILKAE